MGVQKNATYKVHNGTDFDEINFKTLASQVKMASGIDLEDGFLCNKTAGAGYTKLPNGLIIQWGHITVPLAGTSLEVEFNFPIAFKEVFIVNSSVQYAATFWASSAWAKSLTTGGFKMFSTNNMPVTGNLLGSIIAIGK